MSRSAGEISALLIAAGLVEQAQDQLRGVGDYQRHREQLKAFADDLAATAVADKVKLSNDVMQNYGRE